MSSYPVEVVICGVCGMPAEYCEFGPNFKKCQPWLIANCPDLYSQLLAPAASSKDGDAAAGASSSSANPDDIAAGIAGVSLKDEAATEKAKPKAPKKLITLEVVKRGRKNVTMIHGLGQYDVKLKEAASVLGKRFGSGATISKHPNGTETVDVQGDFQYELPEMLNELYGIPEKYVKVKE